MKRAIWVVLAVVIGVGAYFGGMYHAKNAKQPLLWFSQINGGKPLIDQIVKCPNGKDIGRVQVDLNLTNGKWRVIRNDPGKWPSCD